MIATGPCFGCQLPFSFNPELVPSIWVDGVRQPVCQRCVERFNPVRIANGREPFRPLPGAYDAEAVA